MTTCTRTAQPAGHVSRHDLDALRNGQDYDCVHYSHCTEMGHVLLELCSRDSARSMSLTLADHDKARVDYDSARLPTENDTSKRLLHRAIDCWTAHARSLDKVITPPKVRARLGFSEVWSRDEIEQFEHNPQCQFFSVTRIGTLTQYVITGASDEGYLAGRYVLRSENRVTRCALSRYYMPGASILGACVWFRDTIAALGT